MTNLAAIGALMALSPTADQPTPPADPEPPPRVETLLVSGLHANEMCAPLVAEQVERRLRERRAAVAHVRIPRPATLLGLLDDPTAATLTYSKPFASRKLDMDLETLSEFFERQYPGALVFEFHN